MNHVHAKAPVSERVIYRSERRSGGVLEARFVTWPDHESLSFALLNNGKALYLSLAPHEVRAAATAMLATADERGWS